jgi:hypothetical protein
MPTMVHTMLVRVGSMVCWGGVGSASAGACGWETTEFSAEARSGPSAAGRSALMVASLPFGRS